MQRKSARTRQGLTTAIVFALGCDVAQAAGITVTDGGDGGTAGTCTLRQAIASANNDAAGSSTCIPGSSGSDTIAFAGALANATITLGQGELAITTPVTITGSGQTFDANYASRVMSVSTTGALTASRLTITHGTVGGGGGGIYVSGSGSVDLSYVTIADNAAQIGGGLGALVLPSGLPSVTLSHCLISGNTAAHQGAGLVDFQPSGSPPTLTITDSEISGNIAGTGPTDEGGGVYTRFVIVNITRTTVSGNSAHDGGGIFGVFSGIRIVDSTISNNNAALNGGGILAGTSGLSVANTTITGNDAVGTGGAIFVANDVANIVNSTISGNTAAASPGVALLGTAPGGQHATLYNNIIANTGGDCDSGTIAVVAKNNLMLAAGCGISNGTDGNILGQDPQLGALLNNGGPTKTMAPGPLSPALDAGDPTLAIFLTFNSSDPLNYDQRGSGFPRTLAGKVDMGAYQHKGNDRIFTDGLEPGP